ncbi:hypothetical protein GQ457_07G038850 [Hibiscus cannabinus]
MTRFSSCNPLAFDIQLTTTKSMMMLGRGKEDLDSPETELSGDVSGKLNVFMTEYSYEGLVQEEKVEEIMQELYKEITLATSSSNTSPPTTISESCGASMSDSSSTVMAGIEFVGPTKKMHMPGVKGGSPEKELWIVDTGFEFDGEYDIINNNVVNIAGGGEGETERMEGFNDLDLVSVLVQSCARTKWVTESDEKKGNYSKRKKRALMKTDCIGSVWQKGVGTEGEGGSVQRRASASSVAKPAQVFDGILARL